MAYIKGGFSLHDALGKPWCVGNPEIWYSNARVNNTELDRIKNHHRIGHDRLYDVNGNRIIPNLHQAIYDIVLFHHEKLNGTGPEGMFGHDTPLIAQLAAIIDQIVSRRQPKAYHVKQFTLQSAVQSVQEANGNSIKLYNEKFLERVAMIFKSNTHVQLPSLRWLK